MVSILFCFLSTKDSMLFVSSPFVFSSGRGICTAKSKNSFLSAMTPPTHESSAPAWYRRLPKPPTEPNPTFRRTSLLSQHHLLHGRSPGRELEERAPQGSPVHAHKSSQPRNGSQEYIAALRLTTDGETETASSSKRGRLFSMAEEGQTQAEPASSTSNVREHLCLCPPDPKIPRPRNCMMTLPLSCRDSLGLSTNCMVIPAFILFRQHQQASIMAQNPGIPNPEVSKIIGEQWRRLSVEAKEEWNLLAEVSKKANVGSYKALCSNPFNH